MSDIILIAGLGPAHLSHEDRSGSFFSPSFDDENAFQFLDSYYVLGSQALKLPREFIQQMNDYAPIVKPEEALCVTEILEGIYESARTGKPYFFN